MSAVWPTAMAPEARPRACAPPRRAVSNRCRPVEAPTGPSRLRFCSRRRCPYSSVRNSSLTAMRTLLSVPTAKRPPAAAKRGASKMPSPRLASVIGHRPATAPDFAKRRALIGRHVRAVDQTPARVDMHVVQQPLNGARAGPGHAVFHLARLLGGVDVDGAGGPLLDERTQLRSIDGAQRMRRDAEGRAFEPTDMALAGLQQAPEAVEVEQEACLPGRGRLAAAAAVGIEGGQQRQPDAAHFCGGDDAAAGLRRVGIVRAVGRVVQIVELADGGEARFQHLHVGPGRDGLDVVGRHGGEKAVHHLAPGPEAVVLGAAPLHQPGHGALEGVAVHIGDARHGHSGKPLAPSHVGVLSGARPVMVLPASVIRTSRRHPSSSSARATWICAMIACLLERLFCRAALRTPSRYV